MIITVGDGAYRAAANFNALEATELQGSCADVSKINQPLLEYLHMAKHCCIAKAPRVVGNVLDAPHLQLIDIFICVFM